MVIKHIFFDIGGVLLEIDHVRLLQYWSDCTDLSIDVIKDRFPQEEHDQYEIGKITDHEFFRSVKDALPQPNCLKEDDFWRGWNKLIVAETETVKLLPILKQSVNVYLLSNTNPRHIKHEVASRFSFQNNVNRAFYSFDLGCRKPDEKIYLKALELAGAKPEESLFIDDLKINLEVAKSHGMKTILYNDYHKLFNELSVIKGLSLN
jgi:HAD superfamily hydrolase (TIGR01509 family)